MKKEKYLNQLVDVIRVLRGSEIELAKKHLKAYGTNHTVNSRKMFHLYQNIKSKKITDFDKLKKKISPKSTNESFNRLIKRTLERIQESLIVDVNIKRKGAYSDLFRMKFFLNKQIIQGQILFGRGLKDRPLALFDSVIRNAKKMELYDELIDSLYFKQMILSSVAGSKFFHSLEEEMRHFENSRVLYRKARSLYQIYNTTNFNKSQNNAVDESLLKRIDELKLFFEETNSANILSYYFLLKIDVERVKKNDEEVVKLLRDFIVLLKNSPAVYSVVRIGYLYNELANAELSLLNLKIAEKEILSSFNWVKQGSISFFSYSITLIRVLILKEDLIESTNGIKKVLDHPSINKFPIYESTVLYQQSIVAFLENNFKLAIKNLSQKNEIEKDKEGWNVWIRIMRLLCSIELGELELIDYDIESFRKYLERVDKQYEVRERDKLVLKILQELDRQDYDFEAVSILREKELALLQSTNPETAWTPDSPELVLFHDWFQAKLEKRPYKANFEPYKQAQN